MREFPPITTARELLLLDEGDMVRGYRNGRRGRKRPTSACSRGYWHGWRNGMADAGRHPPSADMEFLKSDVLMTIRHCHSLQ